MADTKPTSASLYVLQKNIFRNCILLIVTVSFSLQAHAQVWIQGYLKDKFTHKGIAHGEVRSALSNTITDSTGFFRIRITEGDVVSAKASGYKFDTVHFSFRTIDSALVLELQPTGNVMQNVTVATSYSAYQIDSIRRRRAFDEGRSKTSFISKQPHPGFGLVFNLDRLTKTKDKGSKKKQQQIYEETEEWAYIHYRFPDSLVQSYTGLSGDSLHVFMNHYMPSYEWLRAHPSKEELVYYINEKLKLYRREKPKTF